MIESSGGLLWCRETEVHIPLLLISFLPVYHKTAQDTMKTQTVQYVSIEAIIKRHKTGDITYRAPIIRCPVL